MAGSVSDWPAFEDSHDALTVLGKRFKLIVLSNVDRASFAGSEVRLGVEFTRVLTAEEIGSDKPLPRNFEALTAEAQRLGMDHGGLLHVAQSLFHDHVSAKRVGLPICRARHRSPGTDFRLARFMKTRYFPSVATAPDARPRPSDPLVANAGAAVRGQETSRRMNAGPRASRDPVAVRVGMRGRRPRPRTVTIERCGSGDPWPWDTFG